MNNPLRLYSITFNFVTSQLKKNLTSPPPPHGQRKTCVMNVYVVRLFCKGLSVWKEGEGGQCVSRMKRFTFDAIECLRKIFPENMVFKNTRLHCMNDIKFVDAPTRLFSHCNFRKKNAIPIRVTNGIPLFSMIILVDFFPTDISSNNLINVREQRQICM